MLTLGRDAESVRYVPCILIDTFVVFVGEGKAKTFLLQTWLMLCSVKGCLGYFYPVYMHKELNSFLVCIVFVHLT